MVQKFLENLPGVTKSDSMGYRIEALRVYLEGVLGDEIFLAAYRHLVVSVLPKFKFSNIFPIKHQT